jgi:hypothetical protein
MIFVDFALSFLVNGFLSFFFQIIISEHGKSKPALIITDDFEISLEKVVCKYRRSRLSEKELSNKLIFFYLSYAKLRMAVCERSGVLYLFKFVFKNNVTFSFF